GRCAAAWLGGVKTVAQSTRHALSAEFLSFLIVVALGSGLRRGQRERYSLGVLAPAACLGAQLPAPQGRDAVVLGLAARLTHAPFLVHQAFALQPMQRGIE